MKKILLFLTLLIMTGCSIPQNRTPKEKVETPDTAQIATFAGGCFWCIESAFEGTDGVYEAISGYAGGDKSDASYKLVARGETNHKESVQVYYDDTAISYEELVDIFWQQIDPTDDGGQFADRGTHYRTAIFYHDETQKKLAEKSKQELEISEKFNDPIVTEILPFGDFFPAEEHHQDYAQKQSTHYQLYKEGSGRGGFIRRVWKK